MAGMNKAKRFLSILVLLLVVCVPLRSSSVISARTTCPTSGPLAVASTSTVVVWATIQAPFANAGTIYVGQSTVTSTTGVQLAPGGSVTLAAQGNAGAYNLSKVYFACGTNTDTIVYVGAQ